MKTSELLDVHPLLFDRVRLSIMAHLSLAKAAVDFNALIEALGLTKGNLSTHVGKLESQGLIKIEKAFIGKKPHTTYRCTAKGKKEIKKYLSTIESVLRT